MPALATVPRQPVLPVPPTAAAPVSASCEEHHLVILDLSSHRVSATLARLHPEQPDRGEQILAHQAIDCRWHDLSERSRREAARDVIRLAEDQGRVDIHSAYVCAADPTLASHPAGGYAALGADVTLTAGDVATALRRCREQATGVDRELVDLLPTVWRVRSRNGEREVAQPIGEVGHALTCDGILITARAGHRAALEGLCQDIDLYCEGVLARPLALYRGVVGRLGQRGSSLVIDCGGRHTQVLVQRQRRLVHIETHPFGGDDLTQRLADEFNIEADAAERLKHGVDLAMARVREHEGQQTLADLLGSEGIAGDPRLPAAAALCRQEIERQFRALAEDLRTQGILAQTGTIHLVGRGALLGGLVGVLREIFDLKVVLGSGDRGREPASELVDILTSGLVLVAADRRRVDLASRTDVRRQVSGLWQWLTAKLV